MNALPRYVRYPGRGPDCYLAASHLGDRRSRGKIPIGHDTSKNGEVCPAAALDSACQCVDTASCIRQLVVHADHRTASRPSLGTSDHARLTVGQSHHRGRSDARTYQRSVTGRFKVSRIRRLCPAQAIDVDPSCQYCRRNARVRIRSAKWREINTPLHRLADLARGSNPLHSPIVEDY